MSTEDGSSELRIKLRSQAMQAQLPPAEIGRLIVETTQRLLGDESITDGRTREYAARYITFLGTRQEVAVQEADAFQGALPNDEVPKVALGALMFGAGSDMIQQYGHPFLPGGESAGATEGTGYYALEGRSAAEAHLAAAYDAMINPPAQQ